MLPIASAGPSGRFNHARNELASDPAACTAALERQIESGGPTRQNCISDPECPRRYSLKLINCSAGGTRSSTDTDVARREMQHRRAMAACRNSKVVLSGGGWCLSPPPLSGARECSSSPYATGCNVRVPALAMGVPRKYFLPRLHFVPDGRVLALLEHALALEPTGVRPTLADMGAGVGQFCASLKARDSRYECTSYDGAGNVEAISGGQVRWVNLTSPASLPRADWVLSVEVGEHVPNHLEPMLIHNLHAHNCRGIILSWGARYRGMGRGHADVNYHSARYLIRIFERLGYSEHSRRLLALRRRPQSRGVLYSII